MSLSCAPIVTWYSINLLIMNELQYLESVHYLLLCLASLWQAFRLNAEQHLFENFIVQRNDVQTLVLLYDGMLCDVSLVSVHTQDSIV